MPGKEYPQGMTVGELKALVANWEETDLEGNPVSVWIGTGGGLFRPIYRAMTSGPEDLVGAQPSGDLLLDSDEARV